MLRPILGIVLVASVSTAHAQTRVSEEEFLVVLSEGGPGLSALSERVGAARAERARAGLLVNPTVNFEHEAPREAAEQTTWTLSWTPPLDFRRGAHIRSATAGLQAAQHQLEADRLRLRSEVRQAFADWALGEERRAAAVGHLAAIQRLGERMKARARTGEESGLAARRVSLAALEVEAEAARAEAGGARSRARAMAWHPGLPPDAMPELPSLPALSDSHPTASRPDLLALTKEVERAEWDLKGQSRFLRFPELSFGWERIREQGEVFEGPVLGLSWQAPLFERRQPERIEATARLTAAKARLELLKTRADVERIAARAAYLRLREAALQGLETAREGEQVVESATATFRMGESRLTDLLETLRSVLAARLAAIDLYASALEAHRDLEIAEGRILTGEGGSR
jgi:outer membrane protein TolC